MGTQVDSHRLLKSISKEAFELLEDKTRRNILTLLKENELTAKDLSNRLNVSPQNIYHHLKKLIEADLILEIQEKRMGHMIESYYTATSDTFVYHEDEMNGSDVHGFLEVLNGLNELGAKLIVNEENAEMLLKISQSRSQLLDSPNPLENICGYCSFSGLFMKFGPMNPMLLTKILQFNSLMKMSDNEFKRALTLTRELRKFLISIREEEETSIIE
jgi:DNA-binding transcriptional ArsR family regulator